MFAISSGFTVSTAFAGDFEEGNALRLSAIGYWKNRSYPHLPDPNELTTPHFDTDLKEKAINYLRSACCYIGIDGFSWYRFKNCEKARGIGCDEYWDGRHVWPEGLPHYLEEHNLVLPKTFILFMNEHNWQPPKNLPYPGEIEGGIKLITLEKKEEYLKGWSNLNGFPHVSLDDTMTETLTPDQARSRLGNCHIL